MFPKLTFEDEITQRRSRGSRDRRWNKPKKGLEELGLSDLVPARTILNDGNQHIAKSVDSRALGILFPVPDVGCQELWSQHCVRSVDSAHLRSQHLVRDVDLEDQGPWSTLILKIIIRNKRNERKSQPMERISSHLFGDVGEI